MDDHGKRNRRNKCTYTPGTTRRNWATKQNHIIEKLKGAGYQIYKIGMKLPCIVEVTLFYKMIEKK